MNENQKIVIFCTVPNRETALKISQPIIEEKLAACVNIVPSLISIYKWKGKIAQDSEELLIIKTTQQKFNVLETRIKQLHPYEVPEIIALPIVIGSDKYLNWVEECLK